VLSATAAIFLHFVFARLISDFPIGEDLWFYGIALALISTVLPSFLISNRLKSIGSSNVAIISSIGPVSTIIQAHYFFKGTNFYRTGYRDGSSFTRSVIIRKTAIKGIILCKNIEVSTR
jgi:drug/metabolite transporter (DMT)-like permease